MRLRTALPPRRGVCVVLTLLASLIIGGGETFAATPLSTHSPVGPWSYVDTTSSPAAKCFYVGTVGAIEFDHMVVQPPTVRWYGAHHFASGTVGWVIKLQHWDGSHWDTVRTTSEARGLATRTAAAPLHPRRVDWAAPHNRKYRAVVRIRWMTPDADTIGSVLVRIDHYRRDFDHATASACPAELT
jgi:hypothetical protein